VNGFWAGLPPLDLQTMYLQMTERGRSARKVRYGPVLVKSAMQRACVGVYYSRIPPIDSKYRSGNETKCAL
jgi:hypothetical protein